jgi:RNA polymerase sigma factor for flagellar operon FliA
MSTVKDLPQREQIVVDNRRMVQRIANRMASRYPSSVDVDDLVSIGTMGLIDAADRFDNVRNATFATYAMIRIKGAIVDELRKQDWVPRSVRNRNREIEHAREHVSQKGQQSLSAVAEQLGVNVDRLAQMERDSQCYTQVSMWERRDDSEPSIADTLESGEAGPIQATDTGDLRRVLEAAIHRLPERDQQIVQMYYFEDKTFKEIGQVLGVTESRVSQLHTRICHRLRDQFDSNPASEA